jgi:hypothetical protein
MNTTSTSNKTWVWALIIVIVAGLAYYFYENSTPASPVSANDADDTVGTQVLSLLNQIQSLHIDPSIFQDPGYMTLRDYSVVIPPVPVGRTNPFAPLSGTSSASAASESGAAQQ